MKKKNSILKYLHTMIKFQSKQKKFDFKTIHELVLEFGEEMKPVNFEDTKYSESDTFREKKECYKNAFMLRMINPELIYCEGFAVSTVIDLPFEHAWCYDPINKVVIDPTWDDAEDCKYFGIMLDFDFVRKTVIDTKYYGVMNYMNFDLFQNNTKFLLR